MALGVGTRPHTCAPGAEVKCAQSSAGTKQDVSLEFWHSLGRFLAARRTTTSPTVMQQCKTASRVVRPAIAREHPLTEQSPQRALQQIKAVAPLPREPAEHIVGMSPSAGIEKKMAK